MSTALIVAIVIAVIILIALLVLLPRMRAGAQRKKRERELHERRERVAGEHRSAADVRAQEAERAEREARIAQKEAERQRAESELHRERAELHEEGLADRELIEPHERDDFADVAELDRDRDGIDDRRQTGGRAGARSEFEQGRDVGHEEERDRRQ